MRKLTRLIVIQVLLGELILPTYLEPIVASILGGVNFGGLLRRPFSLVDVAIENHHHTKTGLMNVTKLTQTLVWQSGDLLVQKLERHQRHSVSTAFIRGCLTSSISIAFYGFPKYRIFTQSASPPPYLDCVLARWQSDWSRTPGKAFLHRRLRNGPRPHHFSEWGRSLDIGEGDGNAIGDGIGRGRRGSRGSRMSARLTHPLDDVGHPPISRVTVVSGRRRPGWRRSRRLRGGGGARFDAAGGARLWSRLFGRGLLLMRVRWSGFLIDGRSVMRISGRGLVVRILVNCGAAGRRRALNGS